MSDPSHPPRSVSTLCDAELDSDTMTKADIIEVLEQLTTSRF